MSASSLTSAELEGIVSEFNEGLIATYGITAASVVVFWDYAVTFDREVALFWRRRLNGAALLFYLTRYGYLIYAIYAMLPGGRSDRSCTRSVLTTIALELMQYFVWAAFSALRAYALSRNQLLSIAVLILSLAPLGANATKLAKLSGVVDAVLGCVASDSTTPEMGEILTIISRGCLITADTLLLYITWSTLARGQPKRQLQSDASGLTFADVLLRNGMLYFIAMLVLNCVHLVMFMLLFNNVLLAAQYFINFTEPITAIFISRFLLDLQTAERQAVCMSSLGLGASGGGRSHADSLVFERAMGSLTSFIGCLGEDDDLGIEDPSDLQENRSQLRDGEVGDLTALA